MPYITSVFKLLLKLKGPAMMIGGAIVAVVGERLAEESLKVATGEKKIEESPVLMTGKNAVLLVAGRNDSGRKKFRYNLKKLNKLYSKSKVTEEMYEYLSNELWTYKEVIASDPKIYERQFEKLIRIKNPEIEKNKIKKYEKMRDIGIEHLNRETKAGQECISKIDDH